MERWTDLSGLEAWVWWDYQVAVLLTVIVPLVLLIWGYVLKFTPLLQLLIVYWRVSSLLAITVYLMIAEFPISFLTGTLARALIPISLWFWEDLSQGILAVPGGATRCFQIWRWLLSVYMGIGFLFSAAFLPCGFQPPLSASCRVWLQPPLAFKQIFHPETPVETLGLAGLIGLLAYGIYSLFFLWRMGQRMGNEGTPL